jgi:N-methylhydantoinase B
MRETLRLIPDGQYSFRDVMDDDGCDAINVPIAVTITMDDGLAYFDFTGTSAQTPGNINIPLHGTKAAVCYAMKAMLDPDVPNNQGVLDAFEVVAPSGSLLNCVSPAAVASRAHTSQRIIDVVIGAMAEALPERVIGAANGANTMAVFSGHDPRTGSEYVYLETLGGGMGARNDRDGKDGVQVHITNTSNLPIEAIEMEFPLRVESYGFVPDSGGAGRYRGGMGLRRVVSPVDHDCLFNGVGERFRNQPWGIFGGADGQSGKFEIQTADGALQQLQPKTGNLVLTSDQSVVVETPGAGGYGPALERSAEAIAADTKSGKFSDQYLRTHYRAK